MAAPVTAPAPNVAPAHAAAVPLPQLGMGRAFAAMAAFTACKQDYETSLAGLQEGSAQYSEALHAAHVRCATKALEIAKQHGGIYNKAAQFIASMQGGGGDKVVPSEFVSILSELTDRAPFHPFSEIEAVIREDLGAPPSELFASFEETPIAAASLAQVHRAVTRAGEQVVVKVQYASLRVNMASDLAVFRTMGAQMRPGGMDVTWLINDFESFLSMEIDFRGEARNALAAAAGLAHRPDVLVPRALPELSSDRVLVSEYVPGLLKVNDAAALRAAGLRPHDVAALLSDVFAEMALQLGLVHGDPHSGNVYARVGAGGKPQLVLLDHGLYHRLSDEMRARLCRLIRASVRRDSPAIRALSTEFAGEAVGRYFPLVLSPWFVFGVGLAALTPAEVAAARASAMPPGVTLHDVGRFLQGLHTSGGNMLGVLHSLSYTKGLLNDLAFPERARLRSLARHAALGAARREGATVASGVGARDAAWAVLHVEVLAIVIAALAVLLPLLHSRSTRRTLAAAGALAATAVALLVAVPSRAGLAASAGALRGRAQLLD